MNQTILITGANGFLGKRLSRILLEAGFNLKLISRERSILGETLLYDDFLSNNYQKEFFSDIFCIIHLAAAAHKWKDLDVSLIKSVNIGFTSKLVSIAEKFSIERFIYMSSIAVSLLDKGVILETYEYALAKRESERLLKDAVEQKKINSLVVLRPPLIYGPGAPGNFAKLSKIMKMPIVLPLGSFHNRRSFVYVDNLCSAIVSVVESSVVEKMGVYEFADSWTQTLSEFLKSIRKAAGGKAFICPFPVKILRFLLGIIGKEDIAKKLSLDLVINNQSFCRCYPSWKEKVSKEDAVALSFKF